MTTGLGIGQMMAGIAWPNLGAIFGVRRVLLHAIPIMFVASLLGPLSPNLNAFIAMQFLSGSAQGRSSRSRSASSFAICPRASWSTGSLSTQ